MILVIIFIDHLLLINLWHPSGQDCFYVLVPVPNNQSKIDWNIEGEKMKNLVIDKMEKDLMPNLKENIVEDFYLNTRLL